MQTLPGQADMSAAEDRERRKISMQKCNITYGFEPVDYDTSSENLGKIKTACVIRDNTAMAESMRQSSIWWQDSDHLKATAPNDRFLSSTTANMTEKCPEPNSMGMTIPEIKEFHRKTNLDIGHNKLGYNTSAGDTWQDFSQCGDLTCDVDIASLCLTTPQCPVVGNLDYVSTATASFDGDLGEGTVANHENIREMRRTHFDVGFDDVDLSDTTTRTTYHRHPFTQVPIQACSAGLCV